MFVYILDDTWKVITCYIGYYENMSFNLSPITLSTGAKMPVLGLGTFQVKEYEDISRSLDAALQNGYRLIDTAAVYRNEEHIAKCLPALLEKYNLKREDIFITTKLGPRDHGTTAATEAVKTSLSKLGMEYVDLYLIHWPGMQGLKREDPKNAELRKESWKALEDMCSNSGKLRAIGVSNYTLSHMKELLSYCRIKPAVLQSEFHPDYQENEVLEFCKENDIHFQSYSTLGSKKLVKDERFLPIATKTSKTIPQVLLRWALQRGCSVIPKSINSSRIAENSLIFDFSLDENDMNYMNKCGRNVKFAWNPTTIA